MNARRPKAAPLAVAILSAFTALLASTGCGTTDGPPMHPTHFWNRQADVTATIPIGWHALRHRISGVLHPAQILAAASYPVQLRRAPLHGCHPGAVLDQMPPGGALVQVVEYTPTDDAGNRVKTPSYVPRTRPLRYSDARFEPYECAGPSYKFEFSQGGRVLQAQVWMNRRRVEAATRAEALQILNSLHVRAASERRQPGSRASD